MPSPWISSFLRAAPRAICRGHRATGEHRLSAADLDRRERRRFIICKVRDRSWRGEPIYTRASMPGFRHLVACLLILCQALVAGGLGPRAFCRDPGGSTCFDSVLSPCCCHRHQDVPCCEDDGCNESATSKSAPQRMSAACRCDCTPIATDPSVVHRAEVKANIDHVSSPYALLAVFTPPMTPWSPTALDCCQLLRTGPPVHSALAHLDSVILRL